ncbi:MAG: hypothetical protein ACRDT4_10845 [Micromonosporaceae bacterium]
MTTEPATHAVRHDSRTGLNLTAGIGLVISVPVVAAWLIGDVSEVPPGPDTDYFLRPLQLGVAEHVLGALCAVVAVLCAVQLVRATRRREFDPLWWLTLAPLLAYGLFAGFGWRVLTAGGIGANIGAGLVILFGAPAALVVLLWTVSWSAYLLRAGRRRTGSQP